MLMRRMLQVIVFTLTVSVLVLVVQAETAFAQPPTCDNVIAGLDGAITPSVCQLLNLGRACYATDAVDVDLALGAQPFEKPGHKADLVDIDRLDAREPKGAAILVAGSAGNPVKVLVLGGSQMTPSGSQPSRVFTLRSIDGRPLCEQTRSGMILQVPPGQRGSIIVNGVTINLGSTAYVVPGADLMFDQDPRDRNARRLADDSRNPNAVFCSGFGSDCEFGDESCSNNQRMLWGPFCRENAYEYIRDGLYRVTLYGRGRVVAGATDYEASGRQRFSMGSQELTLPASYTFCWSGLEPGGSGFETMVEARSSNARIDHVTVEFVGRECNLDVSERVDRAWPMTMMTVYNIQGDVDVEMSSGSATLADGQRMRVYYRGSTPVALDPVSLDAPYVVSSDLVQWATNDEREGAGLPDIDVEDSPSPEPDPPVASLSINPLEDDYAYGVSVEATAYDPAEGSRNGSGIDSVAFFVEDPYGDLVHSATERTAAYCAFGGNESPCPAYDFAENGGRWPNGDRILSGRYRVTADVLTERGERSEITGSFFVSEASGDRTGPRIDYVRTTPEDYVCRNNTLQVEAGVSDDSGVRSVTLRYRTYSDDVGLPSFRSQRMDSSHSFYVGAVTKVSASTVEFYVEAVDVNGNSSRSDVEYRNAVDCIN